MPKEIKQILKGFKQGGLFDVQTIALIGVAVLVLFLLYKWWSARKAAKAAAEEEAKPAQAPDAQPAAKQVEKVPKDRFTKIYKRFTEDLPPVVRRSLGSFAPFVVMGTDPKSTAELINDYTDWERQARFLFGSHVDDPDLKIYLGSRVLVLDMPESVLAETSSSARKALLALWRPLFRRRTPTVVVPVSPARLATLRPEQIGDLADSIRGKINLLSWVRKKPIEVRIALTDLDQMPGFAELASLADRRGIALSFDVQGSLSDYQIEGQLNERLAELYPFMQAGLTDLERAEFAGRFTQLTRFLRDAPAQLSPHVATFLAALMVRQPIGEQPELGKVHLTAPKAQGGPANPFSTADAAQESPDPLRFHRLVAGAVTAALVFALTAGYLHERSLYAPAKEALQDYKAAQNLGGSRNHEAKLRDQIVRFVNRTTFPGFFRGAQKEMQREFRREVVRKHIAPGLTDNLGSEKGLRPAITLLAAAYAAHGNTLGELAENPDFAQSWEAQAGLPAGILMDYAVAAEKPDRAWLRKKLDIKGLASRRPKESGESYAEDWKDFFEDIHALTESGALTRVDLNRIKGQSAERLAELKRIVDHPDAANLLDLVGDEDPALAEVPRKWGLLMLEVQRPDIFGVAKKREQIGQYLTRVYTTRVTNVPDMKYLDDLCSWLGDTLDPEKTAAKGDELGILRLFSPKNRAPTDLVEFQIDDMFIQEKAWLTLTRDNQVREALGRFARQARSGGGDLFFRSGDRFVGLELNPETRGRYLFTGKRRVEGRYTMLAVEKRIVPPLECLAKIWPRTRVIAAAQTADVDLVIQRQLENYARRYARSLEDYYLAFGLKADGSIDAFRSILGKLLQGSSPLNKHLLEVADNSRLPTYTPFTGGYLRPLAERLDEYAALREIATSTRTTGTPLGDYLVFASQIQETLDRTDEPAAAPAAPPAEGAAPAEAEAPAALATLEARLTPAGRVALQMLQCGPESPLVLIEGWLAEVQLPSRLQRPFLELTRELYLVGRRDIEKTIAQAWAADVITGLQGLTLRFPFQARSDTDVRPEDLEGMLHPVTGAFTLARQTYFAPLKVRAPGCRFRYDRRSPVLPPSATLLVPKLETLQSALWDETGQPRKLAVEVLPVAFKSKLAVRRVGEEASDAPPEYLDEVLTLTFISSGPSTLVNFNQRPFGKALEIDWTGSHLAQLGLRLTNPDTRQEIVPERLTEESNWALLRLLQRARESGGRYTWLLDFSPDQGGRRRRRVTAEIAFDVPKDPFGIFEISKILESRADLLRVQGTR